MHRSGTSVTATALHAVIRDAELPRDDFPASADNPRGYSESQRLTSANDCLLSKVGGTWASPPELDPGWVGQLFATEVPGLALASFDEVFTRDAWIWKDPRTCLTAPFWLRLLQGRVDGIVITFRHPGEVAESVAASRPPISRSEALGLWRTYTESAIRNASGYRTLITSFQSLLDTPEIWLARVSELIDDTPLHLVADPARALMGVASRPLKRQVGVPGGSPDLPPEVSALFAKLMDLEGVHQHLP
jgi:hypothetical protein